jgi:ABC-type dipeptide/oligopeptide/nickel transport system permease subunit
VLIPALFVIVSAFAAVVGMQMSLRLSTTVKAVMLSVGIVLGACGGLGFCGNSLLSNVGRGATEVSLAVASFSPITVLTVLINPYELGGRAFTSGPTELATARVIIFIFGLAAAAAYAAVVYGMYNAIVKNFDMTIRRQHR